MWTDVSEELTTSLIWLAYHYVLMKIKVKVKPSHNTPMEAKGGEDV
jgi:hypothetical protein